jgi:protein-disulfide isomerase
MAQPTLGPDSAAVTVDVFEDFACPHCADFALDELPQLRDDYVAGDGDDVRLRHFDAPIPVNGWSRPVANAARSIQDAHGSDAFYSYAKLAYENQSDYGWQLLGDLAAELATDADPCTVLGAATNQTYKPVIDANRSVATDERGIEGTPTVFVDGDSVDATYEAVAGAIDTRLS